MRYLEEEEQKALIQWANSTKQNWENIGQYLFAIPNGANLAGNKAKKAMQMARLKAQGLKPGVSDLFLPVARGGYFGLWIEMKAGKNKLSDNQAEWLEKMNKNGYATQTCYTWLEAKDTIMDYINLIY